jgi:hypothetical protein
MTKSCGFTGVFMAICLSGLLGCVVVDDEGEKVTLSKYGGASYGGGSEGDAGGGGCGCDCGGCEPFDPVVTTNGSSGVTIRVGYWQGYKVNNIWYGYINGGTFHGLPLYSTLDQLDYDFIHRVPLEEYCCTLNFIIHHNYVKAPSLVQQAMSAAWGAHCTAVNPERLANCI